MTGNFQIFELLKISLVFFPESSRHRKLILVCFKNMELIFIFSSLFEYFLNYTSKEQRNFVSKRQGLKIPH